MPAKRKLPVKAESIADLLNVTKSADKKAPTTVITLTSDFSALSFHSDIKTDISADYKVYAETCDIYLEEASNFFILSRRHILLQTS